MQSSVLLLHGAVKSKQLSKKRQHDGGALFSAQKKKGYDGHHTTCASVAGSHKGPAKAQGPERLGVGFVRPSVEINWLNWKSTEPSNPNARATTPTP